MNRWLFGLSFGLVAAVAGAVSACGNAGTSPAGPSAESSSSPAAPARPPGASGTVAAVTASGLQVQNPRIGQVTVTFTPSTSFTRTGPATAADLVVGDCALAVGAPQPAGDPAGPVTATSVLISPAAADGGCTASGFGGPGRGVAPSRNPNRPSGAGRNRGSTASGKITSITGGGFVLQVGASNATRSVTTTPTTTFSKNVVVDKSGLAVGECVTAVGPSDDTGAVAASSISIRQPGPNGCQVGFGGPGRGPGRAGPGAATTGGNDGVHGA
jgi:Domain of unknown function (DUF5666)